MAGTVWSVDEEGEAAVGNGEEGGEVAGDREEGVAWELRTEDRRGVKWM